MPGGSPQPVRPSNSRPAGPVWHGATTTTPTPVPARNQATRDLATNGLAAFQQAREARQYDSLMRSQALDQMARSAQGDPTANPMVQMRPHHTDAYQQWQQQRGFDPSQYDVAFGRTDKGAYAGFKTESDLKAAMQGYAESQRMQDQMQARALEQLANQKMDTLQGQYQDNWKTYDPMVAAQQQHMPSPGSPQMTAQEAQGMNMHNAATQGEADRRKTSENDYNTRLTDWFQGEGNRYLGAQDLAQQVQATPISQYGMMAAQNYGVDPMIARGWYDQAGDVTDFKQQRDINALDQYGMPYADYQSALKTMVSQQPADAEQQQAQQDQYMSDISQITGVDANALLNGAKMDLPTMVGVIQSPAYSQASQDILDQMNAGNTDGMQQVLDSVFKQDPELWRVLQAQYGMYLQ